MRPPAVLTRFKTEFWLGLFCALVVWLALTVGALDGIERITLDTLFRLRGPRDADPRVVVIAIDDDAVVRAGERTGAGWPLPRRYYARAIKELQGLGAKTVAFDVLFSEPGPAPAEDRAFAQQSRAAGRVVQASVFRFGDRRTEVALDTEAGRLPSRFALPLSPQQRSSQSHSRAREALWAAPPLPLLLDSATALGHINVFPETSGALRRVPHVLRWRDELFPSLSLAAASQFLGQKPLPAQPDAILLGTRTIPLDSEGLTLVNWIGGRGAHPTFGLNQLLDGDVPAAAIRGRLVLIGVTAQGAFESRATPFSGNLPAIEFQANAVDDILSNRILQTTPPPLNLALALGFPLLCALAATLRAGKSWLVPAMMFLLAGVGAFCLGRDLYLPLGAPLMGGALALVMTMGANYRRQTEANGRADAAFASLSRGTTLLRASLGAAQSDAEPLLAIIASTARETLGAREVFLILDEEIAQQVETDERAIFGARCAQQQGAGWVWPPAKGHPSGRWPKRHASAPAATGMVSFSQADDCLEDGETLVAAPLPRANSSTRKLAATASGFSSDLDLAHTSAFCGALVAIGRRDGGQFSHRDALLLETLAEGAALALENWRYSARLRGRVESANRELADAYQLLSEQNAKLFAAIESFEAALVVCDSGGLAVFVNSACARVLRGATPILGEPVVSALAAGDLQEFAALFHDLEAIRPDSEKQRIEVKRGPEILAAQFTPLVSEESLPLGAMLVVSNVTVERELDRMKTDFVGYIAHELRTPLTTILGYASLIDQAAGHFTIEQTREMTAVISRHCRRMNRLIGDLLDISQLENGAALRLQRTIFDLAALGERIVEEQRLYLNGPDFLDVQFDCAVRPLEWYGDPDRIEQIVMNLLSNAIKYSPDGGKITLHLRREAEHEAENEAKIIVLEVRDEGMGLSAEQIGQLFQKFYRTSDAQSRGIKGTGLGLNLVKEIVAAHGGTIEALSERDNGGKGATFRISLPVTAPETTFRRLRAEDLPRVA